MRRRKGRLYWKCWPSLDQATARIEGEAIGDPIAVARMQVTLGESHLGLGYPKKAINLFEQGIRHLQNPARSQAIPTHSIA